MRKKLLDLNLNIRVTSIVIVLTIFYLFVTSAVADTYESANTKIIYDTIPRISFGDAYDDVYEMTAENYANSNYSKIFICIIAKSRHYSTIS